MYKLKIELLPIDEQLADLIQTNTIDEEVRVMKSKGLLGTTEIIVAIIAATPIIITQIANVIKSYIDRNNTKALTLKINNEEVSFTGYSIEEIESTLKRRGQPHK